MNTSTNFAIQAIILLYFQTHASILDKYPIGLSGRNVLTCENKCGFNIWLCSCKAICLLYKTCCEDFQQVCELNDDDKKFVRHFQGSSVICHPSGRHMINSCPHMQNDQGLTEQPSTKSIILTSIKKALSNAPVTDMYTNISFVDMKTFSCNALNESKPKVWDVLFDPLTGDDLGDLKRLEQIYASEIPRPVHFAFPQHREQESLCIPEAITSCLPTIHGYDEDNGNKCGQFTSYIKTNHEISEVIYKNIYCMRCYEPNTTDFWVIDPSSKSVKVPRDLSILMKLTKNSILFEVSVNRDTVAWEKITCPLNTSVATPLSDLKCSEYICNTQAIKTSDKRCWYEKTLRLAVAYDHRSLIDSDQLTKLPQLFVCAINKSLDDTVLEEKQGILFKPYTFYDHRLKMMFFSFAIDVLWKRYRLSNADLKILKIVELINKAVKEHRRRKKNLVQTSDVMALVNTDVSEQRTSEESLVSETTIEMEDLVEDFVIDHKNGTTISTNETTTCVCLQEQLQVDNPCQLGCWPASMVGADFKELEHLLTSDCFLSFEPPASSQKTSVSSCLISALVVFTLSEF